MLPLTINENSNFSIPEEWNELTGAQLLAIAPILLSRNFTEENKAFIAYHVCNMNGQLFNAKELSSNNPFEYFGEKVKQHILPHLNFLFGEILLTKQLLPTITVSARTMPWVSTKKLYGFGDNFDTLTIAEFSDTESCLKNYEESKQEIWLNRFLAILYRPKSKIENTDLEFTGDHRQPYNIHLNDTLAKSFTDIPYAMKAAITINYVGCLNVLAKENRFLFTKSNAQTAQSGTWADVIHELAGQKFGTIEQTEKAYLKVVIKELFINHQKQALC